MLQQQKFQQQKLIRMAHILARLKTGELMGLPELQKSLQNLEKTEGIKLECGIATIQRDIRELRKMGCDIHYHRSSSCRSYELKNKTWELHSAPLLGADEMMTVVLGTQFASALLPQDEAECISEVSKAIFEANTENFLKSVDRNSIRILMPPLSKDAEKIFSILFNAWKQRQKVSIKYCDETGKITERILEPQALVFHDMVWYVRAFCHLRKAVRTFVVTRIRNITPCPETFENRLELYQNLTFDNFDSREAYKNIDKNINENIEIRLTAAGRQYAIAHILHSEQKIEKNSDDSFRMTVPPVAKQRVIKWILSQQGNAIPVAPTELKEDIRQACQNILKTL